MSYTVKIINIENNVNNILLTDNLTIEILKVKYNWILNASIKNAVLGLNDYGLVWYMGEWICGEWEDGTWYSGIFHDGIWKNGRWYSYLLDKSMILTKRFVIIEEDKMYSQFLNGKWYNGEWYNGEFGNIDTNISGLTSQVTGDTISCPYWYNGNFHKGLFQNSIWFNGVFQNGTFTNSYWINGKFYNGTFNNYEWWNGGFYGGDFIKGIWKNGTFNQIKTNILTRFGTQSGTTSDGTLSIWENGTFENGQFMSGLNIDESGNTISSLCHHTTHWKNGTFNNGLWFGGHFERGTFNYGEWFGGIFNTNSNNEFTTLTTWKNGLWYDGLWMNGVFKSGMFFCGMWLNGIFENGYMVSDYQETITQNLRRSIIPYELPIPPTPPFYSTPVVVLNSISNITYTSCDVSSNVTNDGGLSTIRGVCFSTLHNPTINDFIFYDDSVGTGLYILNIIGLSQNTLYYFRSFATNSLGTSYSIESGITTSVNTNIPEVETISSVVSDNIVGLVGKLISDNGSIITEYGFIYSTNLNPYSGVTGSNVVIHSTNISVPPEELFNNVITVSWDRTYYFVAYAVNTNGISYGEKLHFTIGLPTE